MQSLISSINKSKIGKLPQMGLRLVNKLQKGPTSDKFWVTYIDHLSKPENYKKLSPHSKCLLSSVVTKFSRDLFRETNCENLVKSIYSDTLNKKCISLLNLELLNMILVSSYTLRIPLTIQQLELILNNINEHMNNSNILKETPSSETSVDSRNSTQGVDVFVSAVYSLAILSKTFPEHLKRVSESETVRTLLSKLEILLELANGREVSLLLFSFDKLKIFNSENVRMFEKYITRMIDDLDKQALTTVFYMSSNNPSLKDLHLAIKPKVDSVISSESLGQNSESMENLTGRESCNILCSMIKSKTLEDRHYRFLLTKIPEMNLQEVCNLTSLLLSMKYKVDQEFQKVFMNKISSSDLSNMVVLDALTIVHFLHQLEIDNELIVDRVVKAISTNGNFVFNDKSVLLLHYLVLINYSNLRTLLECFRKNFNYRKLKPSQLILFYNSLITIKSWELVNSLEVDRECNNFESLEELMYKVEMEIESFKPEQLSRMDLFTLAKSSNRDILEKLTDHLSSKTEEYLDIFLNMAMCNNDDPTVTRRINNIISDLDIEKLVTTTNSEHDHQNHHHQNHSQLLSYSSSSNGKGKQGHRPSVKLGHLLSILVELKNYEMLRYIVNVANSVNVDFETALQILVSCKKVNLLDEDVMSLMERLVESFEKFSRVKMDKANNNTTIITNWMKHRYENQSMVADFLGVLYHLHCRVHSTKFDNILTRLLETSPIHKLYSSTTTELSKSGHLNHYSNGNSYFNTHFNNTDSNSLKITKSHFNSNSVNNCDSHSPLKLNSNSNSDSFKNTNSNSNSNSFKNTISSKFEKLNSNKLTKCTLEQRSPRQAILDERELFDSFVFSLSSLCFNAVVSSGVLVRFLKFYLSRWHSYEHSPILLKCLSTNTGLLPQFSLKELSDLNSLEFEEKTRFKREENEVHTSVFSTLSKMGVRPGAERQIMDYQVDLLIT